MASIPSPQTFQERPPSGEETFRQLVAQSSIALRRGDVLPQLESILRAPGQLERKAGIQSEALPSRVMEESAEVAPEAVSPGSGPMEFRDIYSSPENQIFKVVFFPDRIFHAQYLNASRAAERYRYAVTDARSILDISVLKAQVFMDGRKLANLLRLEYRASRLIELTRESGRFLRGEILAWVRMHGKILVKDADGKQLLDAKGAPVMEDKVEELFPVKMHFCPWINAYQVEIWETLGTAAHSTHHHYQVAAQMGPVGSITRVKKFSPLLRNIDQLDVVELAFRENDIDLPFGTAISNPRWDNNYERNFQAPVSPLPSDNEPNTIKVENYYVPFQKGWYLDVKQIKPVRYRNAMMDADNRDYVPPGNNPDLASPDAWQTEPVPDNYFREANVIEMRWILQREFGGSVVFFHEVTIPPGTVEGTHQHVGSEELYYITEGEGVAYMSAYDDPKTAETDASGEPKYKRVERDIYGLFPRDCVELPVSPGKVIFTKSGGVHGIRNTGDKPLKFVAFLYNTV